MDELVSSFLVVAPLFLLVATGWLCRRVGILNEGVINGMSRLVTSVLLPCNLVIIILDGAGVPGDTRIVPLLAGALVVSALIGILVVPRVVKDPLRRPVIVQSMFRGNTAIYGIPFATGILGEGNLGNLGTLLAVGIITGNVISILAFELFAENRNGLFRAIFNTLKTPIIFSIIAAYLFSKTGLALPELIEKPVRQLGEATTAVSFLALGGSFTLAGAMKNKRTISIISLVKLVVLPLVWVVPAVWVLGVRGVPLVAMLCVFATPSPVSAFSVAKAYGCDAELAGETVVTTTILSMVTLFLYVYIFKVLGYF